MGREKSMERIKAEDKTRKCPECGCKDFNYEKGEYSCQKCGLVIEE